jgi:hypothetical protein
MIYYSLNKNLSGESIVKDLTNLLAKFPQDELKNMILTISLQKIVDYAGDNPIPKITYESDSLT